MGSSGAVFLGSRWKNPDRLTLAIIVCVLLVYPPVYSIFLYGVKTVFAFFAQDTFYYLTVAKNSTFDFFTFDGLSRTNGFHPLWQWALTALFIPFGSEASEAQLYATFILGALLTTGGFIFAALALRRVTGSGWLPLWLIPGPFYLLFTSMETIPHSYSPWAFMNGMETPLSIFLGGLFLLLMVKVFMAGTDESQPEQRAYSVGSFLLIGAVVSLLVLTRLDDIFLAPALAVTALLIPANFRKKRSLVLALTGPTAIVLTLYMAYNYITGQTLLPVSGLIKSTPTAAFSGNAATFLSDLFPPIHHALRPEKYVMTDWYATSYRTSAMFMPLVFALLTLAVIWNTRTGERRLSGYDLLFLPMALYIVMKCSYNILNVRFWNQGYWYYPLCVIMVNFMVIVIFHRALTNSGLWKKPVIRGLALTSFLFIYCFHSAGVIYKSAVYSEWPLEVWANRDEINRELMAEAGSPRLVDRSDGVFGYALSIPTMPLSGFTVDKEGYQARNEGRLLENLFSRGYRITWTGRSAWPVPKGFTMEKLFTHEPTRVTFMKIAPLARTAVAPPMDDSESGAAVRAVATSGPVVKPDRASADD